MARLYTTGFEWSDVRAELLGLDSTYSNTTNLLSTSVVRSGTYSLISASPSGGGRLQHELSGGGGITFNPDTDYYIRLWYYPEAAPASQRNIFAWPLWDSVDCTTGLKVRWLEGATAYDSTDSLTAGQWNSVEVHFKINSGGGATSTVEIRVNGGTLDSWTNVNLGSIAPTQGLMIGASGTDANGGQYIDDVAINDSSGTFENSWPTRTAKTVLLLPTSDANVGSWTGGVGGTTNLFEAVNNLPPAGTATETNTTQIENADTTPNNSTDEYRVNMTTYTAAGVGSSDTLVLVQPMLIHGEDINTGTKTGLFAMYSNPAAAATDTISPFGSTGGGALGTWGNASDNGLWRGQWGLAVDASGATKGTAPVVQVRKTDTGSRVASVCAIGVYCEYTVAAVPDLPEPVKTNIIQLLAQ